MELLDTFKNKDKNVYSMLWRRPINEILINPRQSLIYEKSLHRPTRSCKSEESQNETKHPQTTPDPTKGRPRDIWFNNVHPVQPVLELLSVNDRIFVKFSSTYQIPFWNKLNSTYLCFGICVVKLIWNWNFKFHFVRWNSNSIL